MAVLLGAILFKDATDMPCEPEVYNLLSVLQQLPTSAASIRAYSCMLDCEAVEVVRFLAHKHFGHRYGTRGTLVLSRSQLHQTSIGWGMSVYELYGLLKSDCTYSLYC